MSTPDRHHAALLLIAAQLEQARAAQGIKRAYVAYGRVSMPTALKVLRGEDDYKVGTLLEVADSLGCDVTITIRPRVGQGRNL